MERIRAPYEGPRQGDLLTRETATLTAEAKRVLKQWLAARYGRPAFPDAFEERLRKAVRGRTVERCLARILAPDARYIVGLFFDLGEQRSQEIAEGEPYALSLSIVYDAREGGHGARPAAERVASALRALFEEAYGTPDTATEIALDTCEALADTHMTLADLRRVDQWRLEHLSLEGAAEGGLGRRRATCLTTGRIASCDTSARPTLYPQLSTGHRDSRRAR